MVTWNSFVGNTDYYDNPGNTVWLNDGSGLLVDSSQRLGSSFTLVGSPGEIWMGMGI